LIGSTLPPLRYWSVKSGADWTLSSASLSSPSFVKRTAEIIVVATRKVIRITAVLIRYLLRQSKE